MEFLFLKKRPFLQVGLLAVPLLAFMVLLGKHSITYPQGVENCPSQVEQGYEQPIIAFEFAQSAQDIENVLGCFSTIQIDQIDFANRIDFGFMLFYSLFLFLFFRVAYQKFHYRWLKWVLVLPFLTFFGDLIENLQLFELTDLYRNQNTEAMQSPLIWLEIMTWTKWLALALALALCGRIYVNYNWFSKIIGGICFIPLMLGAFALSHDVLAINRFVNAVFLIFFLVIVWSWGIEGKIKRLKN
jgi:hypothetical protein